jgi:hypothetical protein
MHYYSRKEQASGLKTDRQTKLWRDKDKGLTKRCCERLRPSLSLRPLGAYRRSTKQHRTMNIRSTSIALISLILLSACTTQQLRLSPVVQASVRPRPVARLDVTGPKAGTLVFTFEDVTQGGSFAVSNVTATTISTTTISVPRGIKRADFKYLLAEDSAKAIQAALARLFPTDSTSQRSASVHFTFAYSRGERDWSGFAGNQRDMVVIRMNADLRITKGGSTAFQRRYEATANRLSANTWVTYPSNDTMNGLFNDALSSIIRQIDSTSLP